MFRTQKKCTILERYYFHHLYVHHHPLIQLYTKLLAVSLGNGTLRAILFIIHAVKTEQGNDVERNTVAISLPPALSNMKSVWQNEMSNPWNICSVQAAIP